MNKDREYQGYILEDDPSLEFPVSACSLCELEDTCDKLADDFGIDYFLCIKGIEDKKYKRQHPKAYFKKII